MASNKNNNIHSQLQRILSHDTKEFGEAESERNILDLLHNPDRMADVTRKRSKTIYQNLPGDGKRVLTAKIKEVPAVKELPVLSQEAERKIIESLAKQMDLSKYSDVLDAATGKGKPVPLSSFLLPEEKQASKEHSGSCIFQDNIISYW